MLDLGQHRSRHLCTHGACSKSTPCFSQGVFNADSMWDQPPAPLPAINRRRVRSAEANGELRATASTAAIQAGSGGASTSGNSSGSPGATMRTVHGTKSALPTAEELAIGQDLQGQVPRSTFKGGCAGVSRARVLEHS